MRKLIVSITMSLCVSVHAIEPNRTDPAQVSDKTKRNASDFKKDIEKGRLRDRTNFALNAMIRYAAWKLNAKGYKKESKQLIKEWEGGYSRMLLDRDLGDHRPLSVWIQEKYSLIEFMLGKDLCHMVRLDDIFILNHAIPVVFACVDQVDENEYRKHFVPLVGTVSYWATFAGCTGLTWGTGFFFCGPIAMGTELICENAVAPKLNKPCWKLACKPEGLTIPEFLIPGEHVGFVGGEVSDE